MRRLTQKEGNIKQNRENILKFTKNLIKKFKCIKNLIIKLKFI